MKKQKYNEVIESLIKKAEKGDIKINLGCGFDYREGYINCDFSDKFKYDKFVDLEKPLPFEDNYADTILMVSVMEHISNVLGLLKEIHRVLKPNGVFIVTTPHFTNCYQFADLTQKHFGSYQLFKVLCSNDYTLDFQFKEQKIKLLFAKGKMFWDYLIEPIANKFPYFYEYTPLSIFRCWEVYAEITK